ncbi:peptidase [Caballeronia hypogeia]|uniref:Peptidase n=1 Tax=Caballeronia hypogeia TaxID=1777140 RepID=A0A158ABP1_9BURK|nr:M20 family metallopeptidase [Caballeronia hypogeia]SAK55129.1 peptidase [Caballeronia hypogeia]
MSRSQAIALAREHFDSGSFFGDLARRVAYQSESQEPAKRPQLIAYLEEEMRPALERMGFVVSQVPNPIEDAGPFLVAERIESTSYPTVLLYGHGDVVRGMDERWRSNLSPWQLTEDGDRWYGRGTADNKGQHSINLAALDCVISARNGKVGFNVKVLFETGEECGSPGLDEFCAIHAERLAADALIASDGPRLSAARPTVFFGSRGIVSIGLEVDLREGAHHSGNWGGLLRNPATTLVGAIGELVNGRGEILLGCMKPRVLPESVKAALADIEVGGAPDDPTVDEDWGQQGLTPAERLFGWNTLEVLAMSSADVNKPVGAIPPKATAHLQLRYVVGTPVEEIADGIRRRLDESGYPMVRVSVKLGSSATRLDPDAPWAQWAIRSLEETAQRKVAVLPNLGGTLPNSVFVQTLSLPTIWVPHSYPACSQHAPNEHLVPSVAREGLQLMAGLFWDLGETAPKAG